MTNVIILEVKKGQKGIIWKTKKKLKNRNIKILVYACKWERNYKKKKFRKIL